MFALYVIVEQNNKKLMSDPIKISIGSIYNIFSMVLYLSGLCGKLVNNSPAGVFVTWSAQDDPV